jgi:hypothetical protein
MHARLVLAFVRGVRWPLEDDDALELQVGLEVRQRVPIARVRELLELYQASRDAETALRRLIAPSPVPPGLPPRPARPPVPRLPAARGRRLRRA